MTASVDATTFSRRLSGVGNAGSAPRRASRWYTRYVGAMKILLPVAALGLIGLLIGWQSLYPSGQRARASTDRVSVEELVRTQMVNPRFSGIDDHGQPFVVAADLATPSPTAANATDLVRPRGEMTLSGGRSVTISAERGAYEREARYLDLEGNVTLVDDQGYRFTTARARIDTANNRAEGNDPVQGGGPAGDLTGEGFRVEDRGQRLIVTGQSRLILRGSDEIRQTVVATQPAAVVVPEPVVEPPPQIAPQAGPPRRAVQQRRNAASPQRAARQPADARTQRNAPRAGQARAR
jgi:lipopolysaccharide export system protein LptC